MIVFNHLNRKKLLQKQENVDNENIFTKITKIVVPLKYLSNFWRSLEIPLFSCTVYFEWNWTEYCILSSAEDSEKLKIKDTRLNAPIVTYQLKLIENL